MTLICEGFFSHNEPVWTATDKQWTGSQKRFLWVLQISAVSWLGRQLTKDEQEYYAFIGLYPKELMDNYKEEIKEWIYENTIIACRSTKRSLASSRLALKRLFKRYEKYKANIGLLKPEKKRT
jgi:hypothetical protein